MPRRSQALALIGILALAACRVEGPAGAPTRPRASARASAAPASSPPKVAATASPKGAPATSAPPAASPGAVPRRLVRPAGEVRVVAGGVAVDARYAVTAAGARIVANNGGSVVAVGAALHGLEAGGGLAATAGLIGDDAGAGTLLAELRRGSTVVSNNGGGIISDNGAGVIANHGAGVIANNGAGYALAQAPAAPATGTLAPAAGMAVRVLGLATGAFLPLGVDEAGAPAYEVLTDAAGRYEAWLPAGTAGSVLVVARVPGRDDPRLRYALLAPERQVADVLDEDASRASEYIRLASVKYWLERLAGTTAATNPYLELLQGVEKEKARATSARYAEAIAAGADRLPEEGRLALAHRLAEISIGAVDWAAAPIERNRGRDFPYEGPDETAFGALAGTMRAYRELVTERMRAIEARGEDPIAYFEGRPYFVASNAGRAAPYVVRKPMDFVDFVIDRFMLVADPFAEMTSPAYGQLVDDLPLDPAGSLRYEAAMVGAALAVTRAVVVDQGPATEAAIAAIRDAGADAP